MLKDIINRYCTLRVKLVPLGGCATYVYDIIEYIYILHYNSVTCVTNLVHVIILYTSVENAYDIFERPQRLKILSNCQIYPSRPATVVV